MLESSTSTSTSVDGGGHDKILGGPLGSGDAVIMKAAGLSANGKVRDPGLQPLVGFANTTRFSESEVHDIVAAQGILGGLFPSMKGPRDVVWPRL